MSTSRMGRPARRGNRKVTTVWRNRGRAALRVEVLEDRIVPSSLQILQNPDALIKTSGDAQKGTVAGEFYPSYGDTTFDNSYEDYGYRDPYLGFHGGPLKPEATLSGHTVSYANNVVAGFGPVHYPPGANWGTTSGQFTIQGPLEMRVVGDPGEPDGTPVEVTLNYRFFTEGGTGSAVGARGGPSIDFRSTLSILSGSGEQGGPYHGTTELYQGSKTAELPNSSPTNDIVDFSFSTRENSGITVDLKVGDTLVINTSVVGAASSWQGGFTGLPRGALYADFSYSASVKTLLPDLIAGWQPVEGITTPAFSVDVPNKSITFRYTVMGQTPTQPEIGLYWSPVADDYNPSVAVSALPSQAGQGGVLIGSNQQGFRDVTVQLSGLTQPRATDRFLVAVLDPNQKIAEKTKTNNLASYAIYEDPKVQLSIPPAQKGVPYRVYAVVTNNSLVQDDLEIKLTTTPAFQAGLTDYSHVAQSDELAANGDELLHRKVTEPALTQDAVLLTTATDRWEWLPAKPPLPAEILGGAVDSLVKDLVKELLPGSEALQNLKDLESQYSAVKKLYDGLSNESPIPSYPSANVLYNVSVASSQGDVGVDRSSTEVSVAPERDAQFKAFASIWAKSNAAYKVALSLVKKEPVEALAVFGTAVVGMEIAQRAYIKALDPPDPNYTSIVTLQPIDTGLVAGLPPGVFSNLVLDSLKVQALESAAGLARDRADGAVQAGDWGWADRQMTAAAGFESQAAVAWTGLAQTEGLVQEYLNAPGLAITQDAIDQLKTAGFPPAVVAAMTAAGLSTDDIAQLRQETIDQGPGPILTADYANLSRVSAIGSAVTAKAELDDAIQVRTEWLGQAVSAVPAAVSKDLAASASTIGSALARGVPSSALFVEIQTFLDHVRAAIESTNNYGALQVYLEDAYSDLVQIQLLDATPGGLSAYLRSLAATGAVDAGWASAAAADADSAQTALAGGTFDQAQAEMAALGTRIRAAWGSTLSYDLADQLSAYAAAVQDVLATGSLQPPPTAANLIAHVIPGSSLSLSVLAAATSPGGGALHLSFVSTPAHGTAVIDNNGTPNDPTDDRVIYIPGPTFQGRDTFEYTITADGLFDAATGTVTVTEPLDFGQVYTRSIAANSSYQWTFTGSAGQELFLDPLSPTPSSFTVTITSPDGASLSPSLSPFTFYGRLGLVVLPQGGTYTLTVANTQPADQQYGFRLLDVGAQPLLLPDTKAQGTLGVADPGDPSGGDSRLYRIQATAGERLVFRDLSVSANYAVLWGLYDSAGQVVASGPYLDDSFLATFPTAGTYVLVLINLSASQVAYQFQASQPHVHVAPLRLGALVSGSATDPYDEEVYTFTGTPGQRVYFDKITGGNSDQGTFRATLRDPDGRAVLQGYAAFDFGPVTLRKAGTYSLVVSNDAGGIGPFQFRLLDSSTSPALIPGTPVTGSLDLADSPDSPGTESVLYRLSAKAGQRLGFLSQSGDGAADAQWTLFGPDDKYLDGTSLNHSFAVTAPADGEYLLALDGLDPTPTTYQFTALVDPPSMITGSFTIGQTVRGSFDLPGMQAAYTFHGDAGQYLYFQSFVRDFLPITVEIRSPSGNVVSFGPAYLDQPVLLPESGTYQLLLAGQGSITGNYAFQLSDVSRAPSLPLNTPLGGTIPNAFGSAFYLLDGTAGERLVFHSLSSHAPSGVWTLYGPDGVPVSKFAHLTTDFVVDLPADGRYLLSLDSGSGQPQSYDFIAEVPPTEVTPLALNQVVTGTLATPGEQHLYTFQGVPGQVVYFNGLDGSATRIAVRLIAPDNTQLAFTLASFDSSPVVLNQSGTYRLVVAALDTNVAAYTFRLLNLADQPALPLGTIVQGTIDTLPGLRFPLPVTALYRFSGTAGEPIVFDPGTVSPDTSFYLTWTLYDPAGQQVGDPHRFRDNVALLLPASGQYTVAVSGDTGDYQLQLSSPLPVEQNLTLGSPVTGTVQGDAEEFVYHFTGSAGQRIYYNSLTGLNYFGSFGLPLMLLGPGGQVIHTGTDAADFGPVTLGWDGLYSLVLEAAHQAGYQFQFRMLDVASQPELSAEKNTAAGTLGSSAATSLFRFEGTAGEQIRLADTGSTPYGGTWTLFGPDNQSLLTAELGQPFQATLTLTGTHVLALSGHGYEVPAYSFALNGLGAAAGLPLPPPGPPGPDTPGRSAPPGQSSAPQAGTATPPTATPSAGSSVMSAGSSSPNFTLPVATPTRTVAPAQTVTADNRTTVSAQGSQPLVISFPAGAAAGVADVPASPSSGIGAAGTIPAGASFSFQVTGYVTLNGTTDRPASQDASGAGDSASDELQDGSDAPDGDSDDVWYWQPRNSAESPGLSLRPGSGQPDEVPVALTDHPGSLLTGRPRRAVFPGLDALFASFEVHTYPDQPASDEAVSVTARDAAFVASGAVAQHSSLGALPASPPTAGRTAVLGPTEHSVPRGALAGLLTGLWHALTAPARARERRNSLPPEK